MSSGTLELFKVGPFTISATGVTVNGTPTVEQWKQVLHVTGRARSGVQWAIGDLLAYGEQRNFNETDYEEAVEATGLKRGTLMNLKSVSKAFPPGCGSRESIPWSHHALVQGFSEDDRTELLTKATRENLSWEELRGITRERKQQRRAAEQKWPEETFGVIYACPQWHQDVTLDDPNLTREDIPAMSTDELAALAPKVQKVAAPNCVLYLWAPPSKVATGEAATVMRAWGFTPRTSMVWVRDMLGPGAWTRERHEHLLIGTRGNPVPPRDDDRPDSVMEFDIPGKKPGTKPAGVVEMLADLYAEVPVLGMMMGDDARFGWKSWDLETTDKTPTRGVRVRETAAVPV